MQFFLIDLALALLALLGYRALSLAGRHMAAVVSLEERAPRSDQRRPTLHRLINF
jgi:hypothetical protein